jgi:hypothetical protein
MEFLFPLIVVALGGTMFFFRWRARQRRRLYGPGNAETGISAVMMGMTAAMGEERPRRSDTSAPVIVPADTGTASGRLGDGYTGASDGGGSSSSSSDGGGGGGGT